MSTNKQASGRTVTVSLPFEIYSYIGYQAALRAITGDEMLERLVELHRREGLGMTLEHIDGRKKNACKEQMAERLRIETLECEKLGLPAPIHGERLDGPADAYGRPRGTV